MPLGAGVDGDHVDLSQGAVAMQPGGDEAAGLAVDVGHPHPVGGIGQHVADLLGLASLPIAPKPKEQLLPQQLLKSTEHRLPATQREFDNTLLRRTGGTRGWSPSSAQRRTVIAAGGRTPGASGSSSGTSLGLASGEPLPSATLVTVQLPLLPFARGGVAR